MNKKTYYLAVAIVFVFVGIMHLLRAFYGWEAIIGGVIIPVWFSWVAAALALYLAVRGWQFSKKTK